MTTQTAVLAAPTGLTLTAKLFTLAAPDTTVTDNTITVTERTNAKGQYVASIVRATALPAGDYTMIYFSGTRPVAIGYRTFAGTDGETATETPPIVVLDSDAQAMVNAFNAMRSGNVFTEEALANAPGGSTTVTVLPATGIAADRTAGTTLLPVVGETISQAITVYQSDGMTAVDLSGKTLKVIFETMSGVDVAVVAAADITISGADDNVVTFAYPSAVTSSERTLRFAIRDAAAPLTMYLQGICSVVAAPKVDA